MRLVQATALLLGFVTIFVVFRPGVRSPKAHVIRCEEVQAVLDWSVQSLGGKKIPDAADPKFAETVLEQFLKLMDPSALMFSKEEVEQWRAEGFEGWQAFVENGSCQFYSGIHQTRFPVAEARIRQHFHSLPKGGAFSEKSDASEAPEIDSGEAFFDQFAVEAALESRLQDWLGKAEQGTSLLVRKGYDDRLDVYLKDMLENYLERERKSSHELLMKAVLAALDPYSTYMNKQEFESFYNDLAGGVTGIGVGVRRVLRGFLVENVMKNTPAGDSGKIHVGDIITHIDGQKLADLPEREASDLFGGAPGSLVQLRVESATGERTDEFTIIRRHFAYDDAVMGHHRVRDGRGNTVAVVNIPSFYGRGQMAGNMERSSSEDLENILQSLFTAEEEAPSGLVLDLRGNPGGYLEEAVSMAGLFLGDKPVTAVVERDSQRVLRDTKEAPLYEGPVVLLLDDDSASAAEVLAGALRDYHRAILVGDQNTFGKGSVQRLFQLGESSFLTIPGASQLEGVIKLTTSLYYSPRGYTPESGGVQTHIDLGGDGEEWEFGQGQMESFLPVDELNRVRAKDSFVAGLVFSLRERHRERSKYWRPDLRLREISGKPGSEYLQAPAVKRAVQIASDVALLGNPFWK